MSRTEQLLSILIGEVYHLKHKIDPDAEDVNPAVVFALRHNIEGAIDQLLERRPHLSAGKVRAVDNALYEYHQRHDSLRGYYDIEPVIEPAGVSRADAAVILESFAADGRYGQLIAMLDSDHSPVEIQSAAQKIVETYGLRPKAR